MDFKAPYLPYDEIRKIAADFSSMKQMKQIAKNFMCRLYTYTQLLRFSVQLPFAL